MLHIITSETICDPWMILNVGLRYCNELACFLTVGVLRVSQALQGSLCRWEVFLATLVVISNSACCWGFACRKWNCARNPSVIERLVGFFVCWIGYVGYVDWVVGSLGSLGWRLTRPAGPTCQKRRHGKEQRLKVLWCELVMNRYIFNCILIMLFSHKY